LTLSEPAPDTGPISFLGSPKPYPAQEHELLDVPLADLMDSGGRLRVNSDVEEKGYFTLQFAKGRVRLQARGFVGLIPLNDRVVINVRPRVPFGNLGRLMRISGHVPQSLEEDRDYLPDPAWNESLVDLYASWLVSRVERIASEGVLREYDRREATTSFPRGRILTDHTLTGPLAHGIRHRAVSSWYERSADNAPNRCLKYAIWFIAGRLSATGTRTARRRELLQRLGTLFELLSEAELDHSLAFAGDPVVTGSRELPSLRDYYRPALGLALAIIKQHAVDLEADGRVLELPSIVLDMDKVFESYLRNVLRREVDLGDSGLRVLDGNSTGRKLLFDARPSEKATPDIVCRDRDGRCPLLVEVKNVPVKNYSKREAIEQAITYAASYRCDCVVLAHPCGHAQNPGLRLQGRIGNLAVHQYVFKLDAVDLETQEKDFSTAVLDLVS
jgi:5-methylcytosine-specific restriction enzyme subunit McrC